MLCHLDSVSEPPLRNPDVIAADLQRRQEEGPDAILTDDLAKARREVARCEHDQRKLVAKLRTSEDSDTARTSRMWKLVEEEVNALEAEREHWQATITAIEDRLAQQQATTAQLKQVYDYCAYCAQWSEDMDAFGFDEQRLVLVALDVRVTGNGREWAIRGCIPLDVPEHAMSLETTTQGGVADLAVFRGECKFIDPLGVANSAAFRGVGVARGRFGRFSPKRVFSWRRARDGTRGTAAQAVWEIMGGLQMRVG